MKTGFKKYFTLLFSAFLFAANSQNIFVQTYGDLLSESSFSAAQTSDKGFILSGFTDSYGTGVNNFYLVKIDSTANIIWSKIYEGNHDDEAYSAQQTADGGYILAGYTKSFGAAYDDACLIKTDANGDTLWTKIYGSSSFEFANTVTQTTDGGYVFAGYAEGNTVDSAVGSIYLVKTNSLGSIVWQKVLGPSGETTDAYCIKQTTDKGYVITGFTNGFGETTGDAFLLKTDSLGNPTFTKTYGYQGYDWGNSLQQTSDGGYVIGGAYSTDSTSLDVDAYIIKTDANGDTLWTRTYGGAGNDYAQSIQQTTDGGYILGGYTNGFGEGSNDAFLVKVNANGDTLFTKTFGGLNDDEANFVFQTSDGGYALSGQTTSFGNGNYDFYFVKTDANGNSSCHQTNVHAAKRIPKTKVTTGISKQAAIPALEVKVSPVIYSGATATDVCNPIGILKFNIQILKCSIFPDPNNGVFNFFIENYSGKAKINITNILGEPIYTVLEENFTLKEINLSTLPNGTYFIQVNGDGKTYTGKFLVNK